MRREHPILRAVKWVALECWALPATYVVLRYCEWKDRRKNRRVPG